MLCTLIAIAGLLGTSMAAPVPAAEEQQNIDLFMPDIQVKQDDAYMCMPLKLSADNAQYITGFEPKADMNVSHHIILYGCEEAGDESGKPFSCTQMDHATDDAKPTCAKGSAIIYAWAMGAPSFELPKDVAFKVGKGTKYSTLVLQMHYKVSGSYKGGSGLTMKVQQKPTPNVAGIYLIATGGVLPALSKTYLETACPYSADIALNPFAYRVHTHTNGLVVSGYRVRGGSWAEIGRKDPQLPQMFYPLSNAGVNIQEGDVLAARCTMVNSKPEDIMIGATKDDEMCNFYIMYSVPNTPEAQAAMNDLDGCFGSGKPYTEAEWRRDFGISKGFPPESIEQPAGDAELAKTMGDHMNMGNMQTGTKSMSMPMPMPMAVANGNDDENENELENDELYRNLLTNGEELSEDSDESDDDSDDESDEDDVSDNEIKSYWQKRFYDELAADSDDFSSDE